MNENTKQILSDMDNDISKYFEKSKIGYYRKAADLSIKHDTPARCTIVQ